MPAKKRTTTKPKGQPAKDVERSLKVRVGQQIIGRIDIVPGPGGNVKEYRALIAHPELGFEQVGVGSTQQLALDSIGNGLMKKLWEVE